MHKDVEPQQMARPPLSLYTDDARAARTGFVIVVAVVGIFGGWATWAPLQSAVLAQGVVTVEGYRKSVQHLEGGIVRRLHVRDGDWVQMGDVLLTLEDTQARAELEVLQGQWIAVQALLARLQAELTGRELEFPPEILKSVSAINEQRIFMARREALLGEVGVLEKNIAQTKVLIRGHSQVIQARQAVAASFEEEAKDLRVLLAEGYVDKQRLREHERSLSGIAADVSELQSQIAQSQQRIQETQLHIFQLKKNFLLEVSQSLAEATIRSNDLRERVQAAQDKLDRIQVKAPSEGRVIGAKVHTEGGVVAPGALLMEIVPEKERLIVDARVASKDIDQIAEGKKAEIRFSSFNSRTTPVIPAKVVKISGDRFLDERTGVSYYLSRLEVSPEGENKLNGLKLLPGMPAEVLITTNQRTLAQYLWQPAKNAFARALIEE